MSGSNVTEEEWETQSDESPTLIQFEEPGEVFIGIKAGQRTLTDTEGKEFIMYTFRAIAQQDLGIDDSELCGIYESYKLKPLAEIPDGTLTRIEFVKTVDVGRPQPMKDFKIQTKKS